MQLNACDFKAAAREIEKIIGRPSKNGNHSARKTIAYYVYHDEHGNPLFRVCRTEPKDFYQQRWDGKKFVKGLGDTRRVLYHLPELVNAERKTVLVCEGEKDADALRDREFIATCNPMGAGKWTDEHAETLAGWQNVVIIEDGDDAGEKHADQVARSLRGKVGSVRIVKLPTHDAYDFFDASYTREHLIALVESTAPLEDPPRKRLERAAAAPIGTPAVRSTPNAIQDVVAVFRRWLHLPDPSILYATLGAIAANYMEGDPTWLMLIGPPGSGKTEALNSLRALPRVHAAATITEPALLSGVSQKDKSRESKGGLLREVGEFGLLILKDFTSILSMHRDARGQLLSALREIYDGDWTRHLGTDGGKKLHWSGKLGLVAGCTPTIDNHHAVTSAMGERFLYFRLPETAAEEQATRALRNVGREGVMRRELEAAVSSLFAGFFRPEDAYQAITEQQTQRLVSLSTLVVRLRSAVERDGYKRDIELIPEPESPARFVTALRRLLAGMTAVGIPPAECWSTVEKVGFDSTPALRRQIFELLAGEAAEMDTPAIATRINYPSTTARRALEELHAHKLLTRRSKKGTPDRWQVTEWAEIQYTSLTRGTVPEKSGGMCRDPLG
jgi:hypothetical protein